MQETNDEDGYFLAHVFSLSQRFAVRVCSELIDRDSFIQIAQNMVRDLTEIKHMQVHPDKDGQQTPVQRQTSVDNGAPKASSSG